MSTSSLPAVPHHDIPFLDFIGARIVEWSQDTAVVVLDIEPRHLNRSGVVHGGVYSVLMDAAGGLAGCWSGDAGVMTRSFTLSLTTSFLESTSSGRLTSRGSVRRRGQRVYFSTVEIHAGDGTLCALGEGTFLYPRSTTKGPR